MNIGPSWFEDSSGSFREVAHARDERDEAPTDATRTRNTTDEIRRWPGAEAWSGWQRF